MEFNDYNNIILIKFSKNEKTKYNLLIMCHKRRKGKKNFVILLRPKIYLTLE
jgi:hypothetical protein